MIHALDCDMDDDCLCCVEGEMADPLFRTTFRHVPEGFVTLVCPTCGQEPEHGWHGDSPEPYDVACCGRRTRGETLADAARRWSAEPGWPPTSDDELDAEQSEAVLAELSREPRAAPDLVAVLRRLRVPDGTARRTIRPLGPLPLTLALTMALLVEEDGATRADDDDPGASPPDMRPT